MNDVTILVVSMAVAFLAPALDLLFNEFVLPLFAPIADGDEQFGYDLTDSRFRGGTALALAGLGFAVIVRLSFRPVGGAHETGNTGVASLADIMNRDLDVWCWIQLLVALAAFFLAAFVAAMIEVREWNKRRGVLAEHCKEQPDHGTLRSATILRLRYTAIGFGGVAIVSPLMYILNLGSS